MQPIATMVHMPRVIEIIFDPAILSYRKLLEFFFQIHDPTTKTDGVMTGELRIVPPYFI
jgi:peptide methionine sulfoxide reductase MsrA